MVVWGSRIRNSLELPLASASQRLCGGESIADCELLPGNRLVNYTDPAFDSSHQRALTNLLGREIPTAMLPRWQPTGADASSCVIAASCASGPS